MNELSKQSNPTDYSQLLEEWGCTAFAFETNIRVLTDADGRESVEVSEESIRQGTRPQISYP